MLASSYQTFIQEKRHTMRIKTALLGAAAQTVTFHAGIDYTVWGVQQSMYKDDGTAKINNTIINFF